MKEFENYCWQFYAPGEIYGDYFQNNLTREELQSAIAVFIALTPNPAFDSFDREHVRDLMFFKRGIK